MTYTTYQILPVLGIWNSIVSIVNRLHAGRSRVRILAGVRDFCLLQNVQTSPGAHPVFFFNGYRGFHGYSGWGVKLTTHLHLVPRLRMIGAMPLLPLYAFMVWTETTLPLTDIIKVGKACGMYGGEEKCIQGFGGET
jgi:hypothetical protein